MIDTHEIRRDTLKSILAEILSDHGPRSRMEIFARQAGHRTDAAMTAAPSAIDPSPAALARAAAEGHVLPHLVVSALPLTEESSNPRSTRRPRSPRVDDTLRAASAGLDREAFREGLGDVVGAARIAPEGAPRWFFAVAAADVLLEPPVGFDRFWRSRAATTLCGILALAGRIPSRTGIHDGLVAELAASPKEKLSPWEIQGHRLLEQPMPPKTAQSIFLAMVEALPSAARCRDDLAPDHPLRPGIMPTDSWREL